MKTFVYPQRTMENVDALLRQPELQNVTIYDVRETSSSSIDDRTGQEVTMSRIEIDCIPNSTGQVVMPTLQERLAAAEVLINSLLDEP